MKASGSSRSISESNPLSNLGFDELLALADAAWAHSNALPGASDSACYTNRTSQDAQDNAIKVESRQLVSMAMQINMGEKDPGGEEKNVPANKELCDTVIEFAAVSSTCKENHNLDKGSSHDTDLNLNKTPQQKSKRRKHRHKVIIECKPVTPKPNPTAQRKYVRRKGLNKSSTPPTQVTGELTKEMMPESAITSCRRSLDFDKGVRDESSADKDNAIVHLSNEIGAVEQEMNEGLAYDLNTSMKQAPNNYMPFTNEQAPNTSPSRKDPPGAKPKENQTCKRKYVRKKELNKSTTTTEMAGELTEDKIMSWRSLNFDIGTTDGSSAGRENLDMHIGKENNAVEEETPVGLSDDIDTWMKLALNNCGSLPEDTQAPSRKQNPTGKRKYPRKKGLNKTSPTEMTGELTEPIMPESTIISCGRSINFDRGVRDESNTCRDSLACHQSTLMKEPSYNYMSLPENKKSPRTSLSESNPPGAKLNANSVENKDKRKGLATAQDGNISNSQISKIRLQMVGSKRKHSGTIKHADNSSINLIGAQYNGLSSYQTKFWVQFPNIQKKRRTEKGKTSNTHIASSVTTKEVQLTCPQEDAQTHPYASNSSCWIYASGYNAAIVPATSESTENVVHNTQTFDEFILSLRRLTERSKSPTLTCDCGSITRIRNHNTEPNCAAKQLAILDRQTFGDAERPQACMDALVAETHVSLAKKKRNRKKGVLSSSAYSSTNEMQQHFDFALGNPHLPLGMPLDIAREVMWKAMSDVEALAEQFRQLRINTGAECTRSLSGLI